MLANLTIRLIPIWLVCRILETWSRHAGAGSDVEGLMSRG